jgi:hypothetical protein
MGAYMGAHMGAYMGAHMGTCMGTCDFKPRVFRRVHVAERNGLRSRSAE